MKKRLLTQLFVGVLALNIAIPAFAGMKTNVAKLIGKATATVGGAYLVYRGGKSVAGDMYEPMEHYASQMAKVAGHAAIIAVFISNYETSAEFGEFVCMATSTVTGLALRSTVQGLKLFGTGLEKIAPIAVQGLKLTKPVFEGALEVSVDGARGLYGHSIWALPVTLAVAGFATKSLCTAKYKAVKKNISEKMKAAKKKVKQVASDAQFVLSFLGTCVALAYSKEFRK